MPYVFTPPVAWEAPGNSQPPPFNRIRQPHGISVLRIAGVWQEAREVSEATWSSAERAYRGGHTYTLTDGERAELIAAGYGDLISFIAPPASGLLHLTHAQMAAFTHTQLAAATHLELA